MIWRPYPLKLFDFYFCGNNFWFRILPRKFIVSLEKTDDYKCFTFYFYILGFTYWFWRAT